MNGKTILARLKAAGWTEKRVSGSHHIMVSADGKRVVPVPVHGSRDLSSGTLAAIERQTGLKLK